MGMKYNESFQMLALQLMEERLRQLRAQASLTQPEQLLLHQIGCWIDTKHVRPCGECCGVGMVRYAYTGIIGNNGFIVGRADEDQAGHASCPRVGTSPSLQEAQKAAARLNADNGLDTQTAYSIVTSTIRARHLRERAS